MTCALPVAPVLSRVQAENRDFCQSIYARHAGIDHYLKNAYWRWERDAGHTWANSQLRELSERLQLPGTSSSAAQDDQSLKYLAKTRAEQCEQIYKGVARLGDIGEVAARVRDFVEQYGPAFPLKIGPGDTPDQIAQKSLAAIARATDPGWWCRQLRKLAGRQVEAELRALGAVRKQAAPYVSNWGMARWRASQRRNSETLGRLEAVNEEGEAVALNDCIESSVSNPVNRRNELMVRMRGYEEVATGLGLVGLFFTLTTPSRFHAGRSSGGRNPAFEGASPREAMGWLNDTWALIRSAWARKCVRAFGFRVSEPHHDGTPHCHFLLFVHPDEKERACELFGRYALADSPDEPGARANRWDVKAIDPARGSAAGYLAKYVAKNIDGYRVGVDEEGQVMAEEGAARVRAWASLWGIRQFQPVGSVSVTVWRELRRRKGPLEDVEPDEAEELRAASDAGDWARFVELMGGAFVKREDQTLRACYVESGGVVNQYGEALKRLIGVWLKPVGRAIARCLVPTREHVWAIREKGAGQPPPLSPAQPGVLDLCQ